MKQYRRIIARALCALLITMIPVISVHPTGINKVKTKQIRAAAQQAVAQHLSHIFAHTVDIRLVSNELVELGSHTQKISQFISNTADQKATQALQNELSDLFSPALFLPIKSSNKNDRIALSDRLTAFTDKLKKNSALDSEIKKSLSILIIYFQSHVGVIKKSFWQKHKYKIIAGSALAVVLGGLWMLSRRKKSKNTPNTQPKRSEAAQAQQLVARAERTATQARNNATQRQLAAREAEAEAERRAAQAATLAAQAHQAQDEQTRQEAERARLAAESAAKKAREERERAEAAARAAEQAERERIAAQHAAQAAADQGGSESEAEEPDTVEKAARDFYEFLKTIPKDPHTPQDDRLPESFEVFYEKKIRVPGFDNEIAEINSGFNAMNETDKEQARINFIRDTMRQFQQQKEKSDTIDKLNKEADELINSIREACNNNEKHLNRLIDHYRQQSDQSAETESDEEREYDAMQADIENLRGTIALYKRILTAIESNTVPALTAEAVQTQYIEEQAAADRDALTSYFKSGLDKITEKYNEQGDDQDAPPHFMMPHMTPHMMSHMTSYTQQKRSLEDVLYEAASFLRDADTRLAEAGYTGDTRSDGRTAILASNLSRIRFTSRSFDNPYSFAVSDFIEKTGKKEAEQHLETFARENNIGEVNYYGNPLKNIEVEVYSHYGAQEISEAKTVITLYKKLKAFVDEQQQTQEDKTEKLARLTSSEYPNYRREYTLRDDYYDGNIDEIACMKSFIENEKKIEREREKIDKVITDFVREYGAYYTPEQLSDQYGYYSRNTLERHICDTAHNIHGEYRNNTLDEINQAIAQIKPTLEAEKARREEAARAIEIAQREQYNTYTSAVSDSFSNLVTEHHKLFAIIFKGKQRGRSQVTFLETDISAPPFANLKKYFNPSYGEETLPEDWSEQIASVYSGATKLSSLSRDLQTIALMPFVNLLDKNFVKNYRTQKEGLTKQPDSIFESEREIIREAWAVVNTKPYITLFIAAWNKVAQSRGY